MTAAQIAELNKRQKASDERRQRFEEEQRLKKEQEAANEAQRRVNIHNNNTAAINSHKV